MSKLRKIAAEIAYNAIFGNEDVEPAVESVLRRVRPDYRKSLYFRRLATGAVRRAATLDAIAGNFSDIALREVEPRALSALRVGLYEIVFMERGAPFAAVTETSEYVKHWSPNAFPFVKDILHSVRQHVGAFVSDEPGDRDFRRVLPVRQSLWRRFNRDILPDPEHHLRDYLAAAYSFPIWLADRLLRQHDRAARNIMAACNQPAPVTIRANLVKNSREELCEILASQGLSTEPGTQPQALIAREMVDAASTAAFAHGRFSIEDEFDIAAVNSLGARPGEHVCVLQGGAQTLTHIAESVTPGGHVLGCVQGQARAAVAEAQRLGLANLEMVVADPAEAPSLLNSSFDRVFVEPPSTRTARFASLAGARWRIEKDSLPELVERQKMLLGAALELCAAGGVLVYATLSILPEENEEVVEAVVAGMSHLKVLDRRSQLPTLSAPAAGFTAKIAKLNN